MFFLYWITTFILLFMAAGFVLSTGDTENGGNFLARGGICLVISLILGLIREELKPKDDDYRIY